MKYSDNDLCVCGHEYESHFLDEDGQLVDEGVGYCLECYYEYNGSCDGFKLDNLKYLEQCFEERQRVS